MSLFCEISKTVIWNDSYPVFEDFSALFCSADSSTFAAGRGALSVFNGSEENSMSSSTEDAHSSLNTEEEEEELAYGIVSGL